MFDKRHKDKENLIILNGQLKYYQFTLPYWKKFSQINNCQFLIISQSVISYKDKKNEKINHKFLRRHLGKYHFIEITPDIDKYINTEIDILEQSILDHNQRYNKTHDLENYSSKNYLKRCFYRQLSTLYTFNRLIDPNYLRLFNKILYARIDFLIYTTNDQFILNNGYLYDFESNENQIVDPKSQKSYHLMQDLAVPDLRRIHNFSISDFTYWCSYDILYKYLTAYINNFYKYSWPEQKVCPTVEAQANQSRRYLNDTLDVNQQLWDIYDFSNNIFSINFYFNSKEKKIQIRPHRVKTKEQFENLTQHPLTIEALNRKSSQLVSSFFYQKSQQSDGDLNYLSQDFHNLFERLDAKGREQLKETVKNNNLIIKLNMASFFLEYKSLNYRNVNPGKFEHQMKMTLFLLELLQINPNINIIIHTIDLHRMNWEIFLYFIKVLKIKYIFLMYCPWFVRRILQGYQQLDYHHKMPDLKRDLMHYYYNQSFRMIFYPRYLWKTKGILEKLCLQKNVNYSQLFETPKEYDILFYGCINPKINPDPISHKALSTEKYINFDEYYQFRKRLYHLLKNPFLKKYKIKIVEWVSKHDPSGTYDTELFDLISKSKYTIATNANVQYLVRKYYEIPMAGSILMGNVPDYAPHIVKPNMIHLLMSMSDKEILSKISHAINNYPKFKGKQHLGKVLLESVNIYDNDNYYIEDMINYHQTKIKTQKLTQFMNLLGIQDLEKLPPQYQNDY